MPINSAFVGDGSSTDYPRRAARAVRLLRRGDRGEQLLAMLGGLDLGHDADELAVAVEEVGGPERTEILLPVHGLLDDGVQGLREEVLGVGDQGELIPVLGGVFGMGSTGVPGDSNQPKPLSDNGFLIFIHLGGLFIAGRGVVAHVDRNDGRPLDVLVGIHGALQRDDPRERLFSFVETQAKAGTTTFIVHARKAWLKGLSPKENREIPELDYEIVAELNNASKLPMETRLAEAKRFLAFSAEARRIYETLEKPFLRAQRPNPVTLAPVPTKAR